MDATAQAALVRAGDAKPEELIEAAIARIDAVDPHINAVVHRRFEKALAELPRRSDCGALHGVPFLLKDIGDLQVGVPQTKGNAALKRAGRVAPHDSPLGIRFRDAGLVTLGVTNMPEFGMLGDTQPLAYGSTRNPWALGRSVGGSSGGAAAAVAAGLVPVAHGSDGAGSIRIPAAWCGIVGLKPSRGRIPALAQAEDLWSANFVLTRSMRDTALLLDLTHRHLPAAQYRASWPVAAFRELMERPAGPLRVGMLTHGPGVEVHPDCRAAVEHVGRALESLGHQVEPAWPQALFEEPPEELDAAASAYTEILFADLSEELGRPVEQDDVEPYLWASRPQGQPVSGAVVLRYLTWLRQRAERMVAWWQSGFDLLLTPTMCEPPPLLAELARLDPAGAGRAERRAVAFLEAFNESGQPAISLPTHWTKDGLPVGVQLVGGPERDDLLLQVGAQLEQAIPWAERHPPEPDSTEPMLAQAAPDASG